MTAFWLRYITRSVVRGGRRALFALLCVVIGVASVVALQTATLTVENALTSNVRAANGGDISLSAQAAPLSRSDLRAFSTLQRQGRISTWTAVASLRATAVNTGGKLTPFEVNAVSSSYPIGGEPTFVHPSNGSVRALLQHRGDVLVTSVLAEELNMSVGSRVFVRTIGGGGLHATIRGILAETSFAHSSIMTIRSADRSALTSSPPQFSSVYANVNGNPNAVATTLRARFPIGRVQTVSEALASAQAQVHDFRQFMLLVGLLALLIAGIGILNATQSMLAWRRLEIAMLKAMGFPRATLYAIFGGEAVLLGLAGGVLGSLGGAAVSKLITDALARALALQVDFQLDAGTLLDGIALGLGATLIFSLMPIVRAAAFRPLEVLRESAPVTPSSAARTLLLLATVLVLFGALAAAIMGDAVLAGQFVGIAAGAALVLTGLFATILRWVARLGTPSNRPLGLGVLLVLLLATVVAIVQGNALAPILALATIVWGALTLLSPTASLPLVIAVRSLDRRRARMSVTLVAFLVGVLAMSVTLTVALSLQSQIQKALASGGSVNLVGIAGMQDAAKLQRASTRLSGLQSRTSIVVASSEPVKVNGKPLASVVGPSSATDEADGDTRGGRIFNGITGLDLAGGQTVSGARLTFGRWLNASDSGTNHVLVRSDAAGFPFYLRLGATIVLREPGGRRTKTVQVVGFYHRPRSTRGFGSFFQPPVYADRSVPLAVGGADAQTVVSLSIAADRLTHEAAVLQREVPGALVIDIGDLTAVVDTILNELLNLLAVITGLALGAGLSVVGNGVALAMLERRREMALYKAIGFGPGMVLRFVLVENALAGTLAGAVSVVTVVIVLRIVSRVALQRAIGFDPLVSVLVLLGAALLAVVTAYLVARAPVGVRPIEVLRNE